MNIGTLTATLGVNTAGLATAEVALRKFEARASSSIAALNAKLVTTGKAMKTFGRNMSMIVTAPLVLAGGAATKMFMDFESSMTKIVGLVGVAREQVDLWAKDILEMAPRLGKAPKELADALFFITSAGIRGAEAMEVLEMSAKASAAGLGETKIVADLVTSAMNAYGKEVLNAEAATDVLVAAVREGKAEADALASSMGMVLPIASAMGVSFDQVGGAVAAMTRTGTNARTASMQLRQMLAALLKPAQQAEKAMWAMGTSTTALRKTIREDGLLAALMRIRELTNKYGEDTMAQVFPNIRALSGVLDIMGSNLEDNIAIFESLENAVGSSNRAFKEASDTFEFKWNVAVASAKTTLTVFGKTIAEQLIPLLQGFAERMQKIVVWFDNLDQRQKTTIIRIAGLMAAIGPLSIMLGWLVGNVLPGLIRLGWGAVRMFRALTVAMIKNPASAIAVGVLALSVGLLQLTRRATGATKAQRELNDELKQTADITIGSIDEVLKNLGLTTLEVDPAKLLQKVGMQSAEYLKGAKTIIDAEIIDLQRRMDNYATYFEDTFTRQLFTETGQARLDLLRQAMAAINKELEKVTKLGGGDGGGVSNLRDIDTVLKELSTELNIAAGMEKALGEQFDETTAKIEINQKALAGLITAGVDPLDQKVVNLVTSLTALSYGLEDIDKSLEQQQLEFFAWSLKDINAESVMLTNQINKMIEGMYSMGDAAESWIGALSYGIADMATQLGVAFSGMENVWMGMVDAMLRTGQQIINMLLAEAVAAMIAKEAHKGIVGLATMAVGLGALMGLWGQYKQKAMEVPGMAEGGIVPGGYPHDTYPALLTSGERVIPPGKLDTGSGQVNIGAKVIGIRGRELKILIAREDELETYVGT